jgi:hypothetical protein
MIANLIDIIYKLVATIGIIVAGVWAYFLYVKKRIGAWNLEVSVRPEQIQYSDKHSLLIVNVSLKNIGSVKIIPGTRGCTLSIDQVPRDLQEGALIDYETSKVILQNYDFVEQWNKDEYGAEDELWAVRLISKRKAMLVIYRESKKQNNGFIITAFFTTKI